MRFTKNIPWIVAPCALLAASVGHTQQLEETGPNDTMARSEPRTGEGQASLGIRVFSQQTLTGKREIGGSIVVEFPFGRLFTPRQGARVSPTLAESPPPPPKAKESAARPIVQPSLARACVRAAWRANGIGDLDRIDSMKSRARTSALLPETRFRISRDWDQSYRLSPTNDDPYRLSETNGGGRKMEGSATWKLSRLIFADEEVSIERLRVQQSQARSRLAGEVLRALFDWQRARVQLSDATLDEVERLEASLRELESIVLLDVLTGGWFSAWLTSQKAD